MNKLFLLLVVPLLMSCSRDNPHSYKTTNSVPLNTPGLEGCTYHRVRTPDLMPTLHVIRCPRTDTTEATSSTSWTTGSKSKSRHAAIMIDGDEK